MSNLLPIIEQLDAARTHRERMDWLMACPIGFLRKYDFTIRNRLAHADFAEGVAYLDVVGVFMSATRPLDWHFSSPALDALDAAVALMERRTGPEFSAVDRSPVQCEPASNADPQPPHSHFAAAYPSPTDL